MGEGVKKAQTYVEETSLVVVEVVVTLVVEVVDSETESVLVVIEVFGAVDEAELDEDVDEELVRQ